ncbi:MAG: MBL fold metallo-hydrolase [Chloroflexota bacterium]
MAEQILPNLYRIEVPLPNNPLKSLNSFVVIGPERNLIIDTGLNREECMRAMRQGLNELGVDLSHTDFYITHLHADHAGLVSGLASEASTIYFNQPDAEVIAYAGVWDDMLEFAGHHGFPRDELRDAIEKHPGYKYGGKRPVDLAIVRENDVIQVGQYRFLCVETAGHTRGHMCLYEPDKRILVAGDHILRDITPNISLWTESDNALGDYLASLDKVYDLDVQLVLPGHRSLVTNCRARIEELKHHHQVRAEEVLSILSEGSKHAFDVASRMTWDIECDSWDEFPVSQKWFATGEAIAHLKYLESRGAVRRDASGEVIFFSLK